MHDRNSWNSMSPATELVYLHVTKRTLEWILKQMRRKDTSSAMSCFSLKVGTKSTCKKQGDVVLQLHWALGYCNDMSTSAWMMTLMTFTEFCCSHQNHVYLSIRSVLLSLLARYGIAGLFLFACAQTQICLSATHWKDIKGCTKCGGLP